MGWNQYKFVTPTFFGPHQWEEIIMAQFPVSSHVPMVENNECRYITATLSSPYEGEIHLTHRVCLLGGNLSAYNPYGWTTHSSLRFPQCKGMRPNHQCLLMVPIVVKRRHINKTLQPRPS